MRAALLWLADLPWRDAFALAGALAVAFSALVAFLALRELGRDDQGGNRPLARRVVGNDHATLIGFAVLVLLFFALGLMGAWQGVAG